LFPNAESHPRRPPGRAGDTALAPALRQSRKLPCDWDNIKVAEIMDRR
jgi:hypothetical protein